MSTVTENKNSKNKNTKSWHPFKKGRGGHSFSKCFQCLDTLDSTDQAPPSPRIPNPEAGETQRRRDGDGPPGSLTPLLSPAAYGRPPGPRFVHSERPSALRTLCTKLFLRPYKLWVFSRSIQLITRKYLLCARTLGWGVGVG